MSLIVATSTEGAAGNTTGNVDTTGAKILVAVGVADNASPSISDSKGNTWSQLTAVGGSFPTFQKCKIYYAINPSVGTGHNFTVTGTNASACFAAFDAVVTVTPFDVEAGAQRLGVSSATGGSVTPAVASSLIISGLGNESAAVSPTIGSGFTIAVNQPHIGGVSYGSALAYKYSSAAEDPAWGLGGTFDVNVVNAVFKGSATPRRFILVRP